jgi:hypothetical protein
MNATEERPAWKRFIVALLIVLAAAGCHSIALFACGSAAGSVLGMGDSVGAEKPSEYVVLLGGLGFVILSFPVGWPFCCFSLGKPELFFTGMAFNSLLWGYVFYLRLQYVKNAHL